MKVDSLLKVSFTDLRTGMCVAKADLKVYEVLAADKEHAIMMKNDKSACIMTVDEFELGEWYTTVKRRKDRKSNGKTEG